MSACPQASQPSPNSVVEISPPKPKLCPLTEKALQTEFQEAFDVDKLAYLYLYGRDVPSFTAAFETENQMNNTLAAMQRILDNVHDGVNRVVYHRGQGSRCLFATASIGSMKRVVRHTVCKGFMKDMDMVNANPTSTHCMCLAHNLPCPFLEEYVKNREQHLAALKCKRSDAKHYYILLLNNSYPPDHLQFTRTTHFKGFYREMQQLFQKLRQMFPKEYEKALKHADAKARLDKKKTNWQAALLTLLATQHVHDVVMQVWNYYDQSTKAVFCVDGVMLPAKSCNACAEELRQCEQMIEQKLGYRFGLLEKPFDEAIELPDCSGAFMAYQNLQDSKLPKTLKTTDKALRDCVLKLYGKRLICNKIDPHNPKAVCLWMPDTQTWQTNATEIDVWLEQEIMTTVLQQYQRLARKRKRDGKHSDKEAKRVTSSLLALESVNKCESVVRAVKNHVASTQNKHFHRKVNFNMEQSADHYFQFRNGAFNLKTGKLEPRTQNMYITEFLEYDYSPVKNQKKIAHLLQIIAQILPDPDTRAAFLAWRGYCLTGDAGKCFVLNIGYTAGNGKSTMSHMFHEAFPIYCHKLGNDCLDDGNDTAFNKSFGAIINKPIRLAYMEEYARKPQDTDRIKNVVNGKPMTVRPLFQHERELDIHFKLEASSNNDPNIGFDTGINRRGLKFDYKSRFVKHANQVDPANHVYLMDETVDNLMEDDAYKLALFHIFAPYAKLYYDNGTLVVAERFSRAFEESVSDGDEWQDFFDINFEKEIGGVAFKDDILVCAKRHFGTREGLWRDMKQQFLKRGHTYDCNKKKKVKGKVVRKGAIIGCCPKHKISFFDGDQ